MKGPLYIKWNGPFSQKRQTVVSILGFRKIFRKPSEYWPVCLAQRVPLRKKFTSRRKFWPLEGNSIWKEIGRIYCYKEGNEKENFKKCRKCSRGKSKTGPQSPYIEKLLTQPRTQGIISQTLLSVDRKDPRASWYVSRGEMQEIVMESLFNFTPAFSHSKLMSGLGTSVKNCIN